MAPKGSITHWIHAAKAGDEEAVQQLWERYYDRLVHVAHRKLEGYPKKVADEEDVALAAFQSFCMGARMGRFPRLEDRHGFWRLLVRITAYKALDEIKREHRAKRGGGNVLGGGELSPGDSNGCDGLEAVIGSEPSPDFAASLAEELERLLDGLGDATLRKVAVWKMEGWASSTAISELGCAERSVARKLALIRKLLEERQRT